MLKLVQMAGFGLAIFVCAGCSQDAVDEVSEPVLGTEVEISPDWMGRIEGTWDIVEGDRGTVRIYGNVLSAESEEGETLVASLQVAQECKEYRAERLLRVTVEESDVLDAVNEIACWEVVELTAERFSFSDVSGGETYVLERRAD